MGIKALSERLTDGRNDPCLTCPNDAKCGKELMACEGYYLYVRYGKKVQKKKKWVNKKLKMMPVSWRPNYEFYVRLFSGGSDYLERPHLDYYSWERGEENGWFSVDKGSGNSLPDAFSVVKFGRTEQRRRNNLNLKKKKVSA